MAEAIASASAETLDELNNRFLTFTIGETLYGLELLHVIEIISVQPITRVPNLPDYIKGIINLRGKVVPVIDVRAKFNQEPRPYDDKTCIIVVVINDMQVGLIVDSVAEVVTIEKDEMAEPPQVSHGQGDRYLSSIAKVGEKVILNIDCNKFFENDLTASY